MQIVLIQFLRVIKKKITEYSYLSFRAFRGDPSKIRTCNGNLGGFCNIPFTMGSSIAKTNVLYHYKNKKSSYQDTHFKCFSLLRTFI